jgi:hypothetical protein
MHGPVPLADSGTILTENNSEFSAIGRLTVGDSQLQRARSPKVSILKVYCSTAEPKMHSPQIALTAGR